MEHESQFLYITWPYTAYERFDDEIADSCRQCETHAYGTDTYQSLTIVGMVVKNQIQECHKERYPQQRIGEAQRNTVYEFTITAPEEHDTKAVKKV